MMKKLILRWHVLGAIFVALAGTGLHFLYESAGCSMLAGYFGSVNESTWEHLKLLFWPVLIWGAVSAFIYGWKLCGHTASIALSALAGMLTITVLFYTYSGVLGYNVAWVNILIFFIGAAAAMAAGYFFLLSHCCRGRGADIIGAVVLILLAAAFIRFTYSPPDFGIFTPPQGVNQTEPQEVRLVISQKNAATH